MYQQHGPSFLKPTSLQLLAILLFGLIPTSAAGEITSIESPRATTRGKWGEKAFCPPGYFAIGGSVKLGQYREGGHAAGDSTGDTIYGIRLICGRENTLEIVEIASLEGIYGEWKTIMCERSYFIGFQLRSEEDPPWWQFRHYSFGASDIRLMCSGNQQSRYKPFWVWRDIRSYAAYRSAYTQRQKCPLEAAICGIRTQVDVDTNYPALINVDFYCCDLTI